MSKYWRAKLALSSNSLIEVSYNLCISCIKYSDVKKKDMETAISNYKVEIEDLIEVHNIKKSSIEKVRAEYDKFKLQAFDEMSRLKMKGKIENINKAGLGDVFSK